ncbi:MAG: transcription-repair coupling factor [Gammaproteobacteria bacterium]
MINEQRISPFHPQLPTSVDVPYHWTGLYGSSKALVISRVAAAETTAPLIVVTADSLQAGRLVEELAFYLGHPSPVEILTFPDWETLPYDLFSPYQDIVSERLATLARLLALERGILVVPVTTLMQRLLPRDYLAAHSLVLNIGQRLDIENFRQTLTAAGYAFSPQVLEHGEAAIRGSLIDIYPMGADQPFRIDLFDDAIDSIRTFDPETQRSLEKTEGIRILPAREVALNEEGITRFRAGWRARFSGNPGQCPVYRDVSEGLAPAGVEFYLPLFYAQTHSLFDYVSGKALLFLDESVGEAAGSYWQDIEARYEQGRHDIERPLLAPQELFFDSDELSGFMQRFRRVYMSGTATSDLERACRYATTVPLQLPIDVRLPEPLGIFNRFIDGFRGRVLIVAESAGRRETLLEMFKQHDLRPALFTDWNAFLSAPDRLGLIVAPLEQGAIIENPPLAVISESQLFGDRVQQRRLRKRRQQDTEAIIRNLTELVPGAPVVHEDHGVGRYRGLVTLEVEGMPGEYICIEYAQGDKLYVPVAVLDLISRYTGVDPEHAPLHRLGSGQWDKARGKAAERARDVAAELLEIYARRAARTGYSFQLHDFEYLAFIQSFPFEETPGQLETIEAVFRDMQDSRPMDRLVCGDAGFGKTEVAMRAAFQAVQNGKQVALLVPTTLLAQQHNQNFRDRFADWPVRIESISRFRSGREQSQVLQGLADGSIDIVIGTHKLLQDTVIFRRLGLLIIDEEHRFGVRQKEKFKELRSGIDILTLTATPIPRTLNLALSGLRELSIIATPPSRRQSVKTFVHEWSNTLLREALLREIKRGGQVYFLHNQIETIDKTARDVEALLPEARVRIAHGQMPEKELEQVMLDFYHRRFNVLVCTTIIESGIDVPTANTIIINRADRFGLAQLYQLRGRVGRSHHRAYAYLIVPHHKAMTADAVKRIEAIEALEELGIGFTLATHDLEIRGAGEILGEEQSGHIQEIGFGLYMDLLERAIHALRTGQQPDLDRPLDHGAEINLHAPALIPEDYLPDVHSRLIMYKRIASARSDRELQDLQEEMIDRFGLLPAYTKNLFRVTELKLRANPLGIRKVDLGQEGGRLFFQERPNVDPGRIIALIQGEPQTYRMDGRDKLRISKDLPDIEHRAAMLDRLLDRISVRNAA